MMKLVSRRKNSRLVLQNYCKTCKKIRIYKTIQGWIRGSDKPCRSCSNSISRGGTGSVLPINGKKSCFKCKLKLPLENFKRYSSGRYHSYCNSCSDIEFKKWFSVNKFQKYGISKKDYKEMRKKQNQRCFICNEKCKELVIDHCHKTGEIRKLLCRRCNSSLGFIKENVNILRNMISYLEKYNANCI